MKHMKTIIISVLNLLIFCITMATSDSKPHLRSKLAQSVYDKMLTDENLKNMDFSSQYVADDLTLSEPSRQKFLKLEFDAETKAFIDTCFEQSEWLLYQVWHTFAKSFLGIFMSQTSVNGLLNRGRMFVWSHEQARILLQEPDRQALDKLGASSRNSQEPETEQEAVAISQDVFCNAEEVFNSYASEESSCNDATYINLHEGEDHENSEWWSGKIILDLGAGDGHVTQILAESAKMVYVTETSPVMRRKLSGRGYKVLDAFTWADEDLTYDVVTCLNLLDRCDTPISLLRDIHRRLAPDGKLVVALVLPIAPYVETGTTDHKPTEELGIVGNTLEEQVNCVIEDILPKSGFQVSHWTRLPYLCEGDIDQAFYWLSDLVFIAKKIDT